MPRPVVARFGVCLKAARNITHFMGEAHVHVQMCFPLLYLGKGWTDWGKIWCVVRYILPRRFISQVLVTPARVYPFSYLGNGWVIRSGAHPYVRSCAFLFHISVTTEHCPEMLCIARDG